MLRLAGEAGELPAGSEARRLHLLDGLRQLVGGQAALMFVISTDPLNRPLLEAGDGPMLSVGLSPEQQANFLRYLTSPSPKPHNPVVPGVLQRMDPLLTQHRRQVGDEDTWYRSPFFEQFQAPMGLDDTLYPRLPLGNGRNLALAVFRPLRDRRLFTDRDCQLVDLFHANTARLYQVPAAPPLARAAAPPGAAVVGTPLVGAVPAAADRQVEALPPRLKPVLHYLLAGDGEKQVAMKLNLSRHTVHEYTKMLYRKLSVCSRAELMARYVGRVRGPLVAV